MGNHMKRATRCWLASAAVCSEDWLDLPSSMSCDDGRVLDLLLGPLIAVADAVKRVVLKWRFAQIASEQPSLVPVEPDIVVDSALVNGHILILDFADELGRLAKLGNSSARKLFEPLCARYWGDLISAVVEGQWPHARLA